MSKIKTTVVRNISSSIGSLCDSIDEIIPCDDSPCVDNSKEIKALVRAQGKLIEAQVILDNLI